MKLFVTGGTGFVGGHFLRVALKKGHRIVALKRPGSVPKIALPDSIEWIEGGLDSDLGQVLQGCDVLVHLAAHTPNPPYASLSECLHWNVTQSLKVAEQAVAGGISQFLIVGSCFEYGLSANHFDRIPPNAPLLPTHTYPTSKAAASVAFQGLAIQHNLQLKLLRLFQVYGEGELATRFYPSLKRAAENGEDFPMSAGDFVRDFIAVELVAERLCEALDFADVKPGNPVVINVGTGTGSTLLAFAKHWWTIWKATGQLQVGALPNRGDQPKRIVAG